MISIHWNCGVFHGLPILFRQSHMAITILSAGFEAFSTIDHLDHPLVPILRITRLEFQEVSGEPGKVKPYFCANKIKIAIYYDDLYLWVISWELNGCHGIYHLFFRHSHGKSPFLSLVNHLSISMGHLYHGYVSHNQRVIIKGPTSIHWPSVLGHHWPPQRRRRRKPLGT